MGSNDTSDDERDSASDADMQRIHETFDALIASGAWASLHSVVSKLDPAVRSIVLTRGRPSLSNACENAITNGDWTTVKEIFSLDGSLGRENIGARLAAACTPDPLDEAVAVANVQALVALSVVRDLFRGDEYIASSALKTAIDNGHVAVVQALVDGGAELSTQILRSSLLQYAVTCDNVAIVEYLLSVNSRKNEADHEEKIITTGLLELAPSHEMLEFLVRAGATKGWAEAAIAGNDIETVRFLIKQGLDPSNVNEDGESLLHVAIRCEEIELARLLIGDGHDPHAVDKKGRTLMHVVPNLEGFELLFGRDVSIRATDEDGRTPLHACCRRHEFMVAPTVSMATTGGQRLSLPHKLVGTMADYRVPPPPTDNCGGVSKRGAPCRVKWDLDRFGFCRFHRSQMRVVNVSVLGALLSRGAAADATKLDNFNCLPLHYLLQDVSLGHILGSHAHTVKRLLKAGADAVGRSDSNAPSPLRVLLRRHSKFVTKEYLKLLRLLCAHGAVWDAGCDDDIPSVSDDCSQQLACDDGVAERNDGEVRDREEILGRILHYRSARACVHQWMKDMSWNQEPTEIPFEVFSTGEESIKKYISGLASSRPTWRRKICVIGPSMWGKSSWAKSMLAGKAHLVKDEDRTVGIETSKHSFEERAGETKRLHQIVLWDFAGQDVYRTTHSIFFTERTLYVLCIDLETYAEELTKSDQEISRFVHGHVLRWVETIANFDKSPEFFVVGTKLDKLTTGSEAVKAVWDDLRDRIKECELESLKTAAFPSFGEVLADGRDSGASFSGFIAMSNTDDQSVVDAREQLTLLLIDSRSTRSFQMTKRLMSALEFVEERRENVVMADLTDSKNGPMPRVQPLCRQLMKKIGGNDDSEAEVHLLPTLAKLGEIVWRQKRERNEDASPCEHKDDSTHVFKNYIILDPMFAINIVKEVVNHNRLESTDVAAVQRLRDEGFLPDKTLSRGYLWGRMNGDLKLAFKKWLVELDVAYPANGDSMQRNSDLIVPSYWTIPKAKQRTLLRATSSLATPPGATIKWAFDIPATISEQVLKKFAVRSYRPRRARRIIWSKEAATIIVGINNDTEVQIAMESSKTESWDVISICAGASDEEHAILWLQYYVLTMESVLEGYKQHHIERSIVQPDGDGIYVTTIQDELEDGYERQTWPRTSSDLMWYEERHNPAILKRIEETLRAQGVRQEKQMRALGTQVARGELGKRVPGRWTVQLTDETLELRMLSDEPVGECYHKAIAITVPSWRKYAAIVDTVVASGKDLLSQVVPSLLVEFAANKLLDETQKAILAHAIITKLGLLAGRAFKTRDSHLSEAEEENALLGLLCLAGKDVSEDGRVQRLCKLKRELQDGHFVWVYDPNYAKLKLEIDATGEEGEKDISWELRVAETEVRAGETIDSGKDKSDTIIESLGQLWACNLHVFVKQQHGVSRSHVAILALSDVIPTNASTVDIVQNKTTELRSMRSTGKYIVKVHLKSA